MIEPCLSDGVDVETPRIVVDEHVERDLELVRHALHEPSHAARRLALRGDEQALVLLPELVLVQAVPDGFLLDEEDVLRRRSS